MSSSSNKLNPFAYFTSSTSYQNPVPVPFPFPSLYSHEPESFFTQQDYLYPLSLTPPILTANCPPILPGPFIPPNDPTMAKQDMNISSGAPRGNSLSKRSVKKDRHRKIYTAQGLRDRRVRLSVEISRKFFDLQDMLGYDKASKTLEWLLSKSRRAIKELVMTKNSCCEAENNADCVENFVWKKIDQSISEKKLRKVGLADLLAKESRAKARARARKRTIDKMITVNQIRPLNQLELSKMLLKEVIAEAQTPEIGQADRENMAEKSALIKTKMKPLLLPGYNFPEEESINNNKILANFSGNLEINVPFSQYTLSTTSNSNLQSELKIRERSSQAYHNRHLL